MTKTSFALAAAMLAVAHAGVRAQQPAAPPPAQARAAEPASPSVKLGVVSYLQYDGELKNRDGYNAFDVTRGYINITGDLDSRFSYRITPDVKRAGDGALAGSLVFRVKYAFAQIRGPVSGSWVRLGAHQTPWLDFEEHVNRYRVQGQMFAEREGIIPGSSDLGVGFFAPLPSNHGEIQVGVYNGEGYAHAEANKRKSVQGRLTVRPFPGGALSNGLRLSGFYDVGWYDNDQPRRHGIVMASYEHPNLVATAQWLSATGRPDAAVPASTVSHGYSSFLEVRQGLTGWAGLVRVEGLDPDTSRADDEHVRVIAGGAYWMRPSAATVGFVVTVEHVGYGDAAGRPDEARLLAQTQIEF